MQIRLTYGKEELEICLPDELRARVLVPEFIEGLPSQAGALRAALRQPIGCPPLRSLIGPEDTIGIVFSDLTRPAPNRLLVSAILDELGPLSRDRVTLFNATGTHRPNTVSELKDMLGEEIAARYKIIQNDATDRDSHVPVGATAGGNEILLHREYLDCTVKILTGFIEPHFFAGFSGGGKACMPGLASLDTICRNHSVKNLDSPLATWGVTEGNPVWEDVRQAVSLAPPAFLVNVALNRNKQITGVFAGDYQKAHDAGCAFVRERAMVPVGQPFDIVISSNSGYPLDLNLYQAVKGMSAAANIVKPGGSIIVAADCWDGIPDHGEFARLLHQAGDIGSLLQTLRAPGFHVQDMWEAQLLALVRSKAEVYLYSHNLTDDQISRAHLKPCRSIDCTVKNLVAKIGPGASVCVLPEGPQTIPFIAG